MFHFCIWNNTGRERHGKTGNYQNVENITHLLMGRDLFLHQKIFFLHQTGPAGFSRFCTKIIFFSHQLGFFPAPKQFFSAPNDFGNCIWFCTKLILFLHQNDTKSLEAGTKLFWFCTKYFFDFFWFSTKYIPILHQFVTN